MLDCAAKISCPRTIFGYYQRKPEQGEKKPSILDVSLICTDTLLTFTVSIFYVWEILSTVHFYIKYKGCATLDSIRAIITTSASIYLLCNYFEELLFKKDLYITVWALLLFLVNSCLYTLLETCIHLYSQKAEIWN